ncbi:MAG TPA: Co2+/Mg2+ efflux protein ApaG [Anaeromyxobacter sp.]
MSSAVTEGIRVTVSSSFRADRSDPEKGRWLFTYHVRIANEGNDAAQLVSRHWIITDANGEQQEVVGDGVVGHQPRLASGDKFEYTSFCVLQTPHGSMRGTYRMVRGDGTSFEARIAPFPLVVPDALN